MNTSLNYTGYITSMKNIGDYESINKVNPLYLIIGEVDGYIEEKKGNKYLIFASTDKKQRSIGKVHRTLG